MKKSQEKVLGRKDRRKKILIFNVNWLGDVIFSSPFIRAVREAFPDSYIACAAPPRCKEILESNTRINELIIFDEKGSERSLLGKMNFTARLRRERFDIAFILHRSMTRALMTYMAGIKERVGYDTKRRGFLLTNKLKSPPKELHRVEHFLGLAKAMGAEATKGDYELFITEPDRKKANRILESAGIIGLEEYVVLNPGGNWDPKRWPVSSFAKLADRLIDAYGLKVLMTGSKKDRVLADEIRKKMEYEPASVCGKTNLRELGAVLEKSRLVIAGDSGPMHIAVSTGTNVVALFGPTSPDITGPHGRGSYTVLKGDVGCDVPCYDTSCRDNRCMKAITVDDVMDVIEDKGYLTNDT